MCPNAARLDIVLTHLLIEAVEFLLQQRHRGARDFTSLRIHNLGIKHGRKSVGSRHQQTQGIAFRSDQRNVQRNRNISDRKSVV